MRVLSLSLLTMALTFPVLASHSVQAEEYMVLWPNERADHQGVMEGHAEDYLNRGQAYVDHLYSTGGEERMPDPDISMESAMQDSLQPKPVDVQEVAKIVKESPQGQQEESALAKYVMGKR